MPFKASWQKHQRKSKQEERLPIFSNQSSWICSNSKSYRPVSKSQVANVTSTGARKARLFTTWPQANPSTVFWYPVVTWPEIHRWGFNSAPRTVTRCDRRKGTSIPHSHQEWICPATSISSCCWEAKQPRGRISIQMEARWGCDGWNLDGLKASRKISEFWRHPQTWTCVILTIYIFWIIHTSYIFYDAIQHNRMQMLNEAFWSIFAHWFSGTVKTECPCMSNMLMLQLKPIAAGQQFIHMSKQPPGKASDHARNIALYHMPVVLVIVVSHFNITGCAA